MSEPPDASSLDTQPLPQGDPAQPAQTSGSTCPHCGAEVLAGEQFCESCGQQLAPGAASAAPVTVAAPPEIGGPHEGTLLDDPTAAATDRARTSAVRVVDADLTARATRCASCQGTLADDGYCELCGTPAVKARDHWSDQPAPWLAAVCDRGIRHNRNEDASAVAAAAGPGSFAAIVVCDGVSSATDSDLASLAAARAARDVLVTGVTIGPDGLVTATPAEGGGPSASGTGGRTARAAGLVTRMVAAGAAAQEQATARAAEVAAGLNPPSCTFVAAVLERVAATGGCLAVVGWVGDSRAYWIPDAGNAAQLSQDDSMAAEAMAQGVPRDVAEHLPQSHAITRWLGIDAPDPVPRTAVVSLDEPGWLLVCSDGLWNYCSAAADLAELVHQKGSAESDPVVLADALVAWANEQGGHDNITVALARLEPCAGPDVETDHEAVGEDAR
jgi:serine/threonine protein phosphatase PrpC